MGMPWKALAASAAISALFIAYNGLRAYRNARRMYFGRLAVSDLVRHPEMVGIWDLTTVRMSSTDGTGLEGWYVPPRNTAAVVVTHGSSADRASMVSEIRILATAGFGVLAFDWAGYGGSDGQAHWGADESAALEAAVDWLCTRGEVDTRRIGALGFSMGGYIVAQVASRDTRLRAVVLEAAPTDIVEQARSAYARLGPITQLPAVWALNRAGMPIHDSSPIEVIARIAPRPILILGGSADQVVPEHMTRDLYAAAQSPKDLWVIAGASHGRYSESAGHEYGARLVDFFARALL